MNRTRAILHRLRDELGFADRLIGGEKAVLAQIDRFLSDEQVPADVNVHEHAALWNRLIGNIVVPETSFFRHPESFTALSQWLEARPPAAFRCLCLPCSTGEEAWSIAMTFREAGQPDVRIDAVDISPAAVTHAREGWYGQRAVRGLPLEQRKRWFSESGNSLLVAQGLRPLVEFLVGNAFSLSMAPGGYDVIFCRNLLIYFAPDNQRRLFARLASWLRPDGILFLGPGEATTAASHGWKSTGRPMSFSFVRRPPPASRSSPPNPPLRRVLKRPSPPAAPPIPSKNPERRPVEEIDWLERARHLADLGRSVEARTALEKFHRTHPPCARSLLLRALLEESAGDLVAAETDYRRTLFLEPDNVESLLHLSLLLEASDKPHAALPFRRRLERLNLPS